MNRSHTPAPAHCDPPPHPAPHPALALAGCVDGLLVALIAMIGRHALFRRLFAPQLADLTRALERLSTLLARFATGDMTLPPARPHARPRQASQPARAAAPRQQAQRSHRSPQANRGSKELGPLAGAGPRPALSVNPRPPSNPPTRPPRPRIPRSFQNSALGV